MHDAKVRAGARGAGANSGNGAARSMAESSAAGDDISACRRLLGDGSRSFDAATRLLPGEVARAACALYAFCRLADDSVDLGDASAGSRPVASSAATHTGATLPPSVARASAVADLHERLDGIYAGTPRPLAADRAFAAVVARYRLPRAWPSALVDGFEWDAQGRQYQDIAQLRAYAARVAGSVGAMMARIMGVQSRASLARACELGVAMQLTNIARDVGDDARMGRLYLPHDWMCAAGLQPDVWLAQPSFSPALGTVVGRVLEHAARHYRGAADGFTELPIGCRPGIRAAASLYADIGRAVARRGFDSVNARAVVAPGRKLQLLAHAILGCLIPGAQNLVAPPREIDFLLEAVGAAAAPAAADGHTAVAGALGRSNLPALQTVLTLFERLERRDRGRYAGQMPRAPA